MSALPEDEPWPAALIHDDEGNPTWRYRVEPFQWAVAASGMSLGEICARMGWAPKNTTRLKRLLGLSSCMTGKRRPSGERYAPTVASSLSYEHASALARVLGLDFSEWEI